MTAQSRFETVRINEFMALNSTVLTDKDGEYSDWIELYNPNPVDINLSGWSLTDNRNQSKKWIFPSVFIKSEEYLVLFASGKNRTHPDPELHTNFKLDGDGEYLALFDPDENIVTEFNPSFPAQQTDISLGYYDRDYFASATPTPGSENQFANAQFLPNPVFSHPHGFYEKPFEVTITTNLSKAQIFYTTDGSPPGISNGKSYNAPVPINTSTVLRAVVKKSGSLTSQIATTTYLFLDDVINQSNHPLGYPSDWGPYTAISGTAIADYEMDPEITRDPECAGQMKAALLALPTLSIVTDKNNLFSKSTDPISGGIYIYTGPPGDGDIPLPGDGWERPASVEFFNRDGSEEFQIDCGIQLHGGHSRRPEKSPKHSFRLVFKSEYGPTRLSYPLLGENIATEFNTIVLRAGFGNSWCHWKHSERRYAQYIRDIWAKDTQLAMGQPAGHGRYVHLYLNGLYWGIYNPTERLDKDFAATYLEGNPEDFDVIKDYGSVIDGNKTAWNNMMSLVNKGLANNTNYQRIQGKNPAGTTNPGYEAYVDVVNLIDYMILNFYGGNWDWDHHNWVAIRNRVQPGNGFKFFSWDAEHILEEISYNTLNENNNNCPSQLFQRLRENADFCRLFADRIQLHCFNGGVLTLESASVRWMNRAKQIDLAILAESARWGDYRRDVHRYSTEGPFDLYDKKYWLAQQSYLLNEYFPKRTNEFINHLRIANLFPNVDAPLFLINGKLVRPNLIQAGDILSMRAAGDIYYTTDGTDPTLGGQISPTASKYSESFRLMQSTHIKARALQGSTWSALNEVILILSTDLNNLKVTEIHYHPLPEDTIDDRAFEFIELKNIGTSFLDLSGSRFCNGISFSFPISTILNPNEFIVLASNQRYFTNRYHFVPCDEYEGLLDNAGERITLMSAVGDTIFSIRYNDRMPWPVAVDGKGYSLVPNLQNPSGDQQNPADWRASFKIHGSPGKDDDASLVVEAIRNINHRNFELSQNYPNPFNSSTIICFSITTESVVEFKIYDVLGREIRTIINKKMPAGKHQVTLELSNLNSGIYFYQIKVGELTQSHKLILMK
jgi:hypothetical protein